MLRFFDACRCRILLMKTALQDFKWRVIDWHYQYYMGPKERVSS